MFSTPVRLPPFTELLVSLSQPQPYLIVPVPIPSPRSSFSSHSPTPGYTYNYTNSYYQPPSIMMPKPLKQPQEQQGYHPTISGLTADIPTPPASTELLKENSPKPESATKRTHVCKTCGRAFTTLGHLARHNRTHTGERKHLCPWPQCGARFARQDNCMQHFKMHLNGKSRRRGKKAQH